MGSQNKDHEVQIPNDWLEAKATVTFKIEPNTELLSLISRYQKALEFTLDWLKKNKPVKAILKQVHDALYHELKERFYLPARIAIDCYRDAIAIYKSWLKSPNRGDFPKIKKISLWLTPDLSYKIDLENMNVSIVSIGELKIIGYPKNYMEYKNWEIKEARLVVRDDKVFLKVVFSDYIEPAQGSDAIAVDINMDSIVVGNDKGHVIIPTRIKDAKHFKELAENLQRKYGSRVNTVKKIHKRFVAFHEKASRILEDFAKKVGKWVIDIAQKYNASVIFLEDLNGLINKVNKLPKPYHDKLFLMQYDRVQYWIEWQAKKRGIKVIKVPAAYTSSKCPQCGGELEEYEYRQMRCKKCGYENDRDVIAVINLYGRGSLILSTAGQRRDLKES